MNTLDASSFMHSHLSNHSYYYLFLRIPLKSYDAKDDHGIKLKTKLKN